jgi:copper(I)-binding protein
MRRAARGLFALLALATAAVAGGPTSLQAHDSWIRWLPGDLPAAGYLTLTNSGNTPLTLISASSPDYAQVMFHQSRDQNGMEHMLPVESLVVPPHGRVSFAPGSYHLMLMQAQHPLVPGDHVVVTFHLAGDQSLTIPFEVRRPDGRPSAASP